MMIKILVKYDEINVCDSRANINNILRHKPTAPLSMLKDFRIVSAKRRLGGPDVYFQYMYQKFRGPTMTVRSLHATIGYIKPIQMPAARLDIRISYWTPAVR